VPLNDLTPEPVSRQVHWLAAYVVDTGHLGRTGHPGWSRRGHSATLLSL
jgi:hypothetical protein